MESDPIVDPTVRPTEYSRTYTNGPRGSAVPVSNDEPEKKANVTTVGENSKEVHITPEIKGEVTRLHKAYMAKRTIAHYESLRAKGNISALKVLGLAVLTYVYMTVAIILATDVELNL
jgi:hypothetical protein